MVFETETLDLCHELTQVGEKYYMQLLIAIALDRVSGKEFFEDGSEKQIKADTQPIGPSI